MPEQDDTKTARVRIGIDVGGTFTDLVAVDTRTGERIARKHPSTPRAPEQGVLDALDALLAGYETPPQIESIAHSTTIATNALLGQMHLELPRIVFLTTRGFRDVIEIGRQNRSEVYDLFVTRPAPLVAREDRIAVEERVAYDGEVLVPLSDAEIERVVNEVRARSGVAAAAIGFLHSYAYPAHERRMATALARAFPDLPVTRSCEIDPEYREYERFSTAVVNAALTPIVRGYLERLETALQQRGITAPFFVMQSNGGMSLAAQIASRPATIIESGPASGVIAAAQLARDAGFAHVLSFDMGGTTAKAGTIVAGVVQVAGEFEAAGRTHSGRSVKGSGYPVRFPFVDLAEISAGGGTIAFVDEAGSLRVGPISAGADPGPACYGRSDRATVTDANLVLGRLNPRALAGGTFAIDAERAQVSIAALGDRLGLDAPQTAAGIVRIVDAQMAKVLRIVTVERGLDPRNFTLVAFGGNGPLHACALAAELGITRIAVPALPGVFSAQGLLVAPLRVSLLRGVMLEATRTQEQTLREMFIELEREAVAALREQGAAQASMIFSREYDARYRGQSFELEVDADGGPTQAAAAFHRKHAARYGYAVEDEPVELVNARLTATAPAVAVARNGARTLAQATVARSRDVWIDGKMRAVPVHRRESVNGTLIGPALVEQDDAVTFVAPEWRAEPRGDVLLLERES